jgi:hypothetical protein
LNLSFRILESCSHVKIRVGARLLNNPSIADIFSFGIVLCEIMTGREPSSEFMCRKAQSLFALDEEELKNAVETGCPEGLEVLACLCCDVEPDKRPVVQTCIEELESLLAELGGPPKGNTEVVLCL